MKTIHSNVTRQKHDEKQKLNWLNELNVGVKLFRINQYFICSNINNTVTRDIVYATGDISQMPYTRLSAD